MIWELMSCWMQQGGKLRVLDGRKTLVVRVSYVVEEITLVNDLSYVMSRPTRCTGRS